MSKISSSKNFGKGLHHPPTSLDNVFKYTLFFWRLPLTFETFPQVLHWSLSSYGSNLMSSVMSELWLNLFVGLWRVTKQVFPMISSMTKLKNHKILAYSTYQKSPIFCFAQLLMQILVNFQNQGHIWNLLVLRFSKHPLHVQNIGLFW